MLLCMGWERARERERERSVRMQEKNKLQHQPQATGQAFGRSGVAKRFPVIILFVAENLGCSAHTHPQIQSWITLASHSISPGNGVAVCSWTTKHGRHQSWNLVCTVERQLLTDASEDVDLPGSCFFLFFFLHRDWKRGGGSKIGRVVRHPLFVRHLLLLHVVRLV